MNIIAEIVSWYRESLINKKEALYLLMSFGIQQIEEAEYEIYSELEFY